MQPKPVGQQLVIDAMDGIYHDPGIGYLEAENAAVAKHHGPLGGQGDELFRLAAFPPETAFRRMDQFGVLHVLDTPVHSNDVSGPAGKAAFCSRKLARVSDCLPPACWPDVFRVDPVACDSPSHLEQQAGIHRNRSRLHAHLPVTSHFGFPPQESPTLLVQLLVGENERRPPSNTRVAEWNEICRGQLTECVCPVAAGRRFDFTDERD
ncbi:MAG: hypothetical protein NTU53_16305 [Planctomycetota bacterium]|nr:hypothetical protein [Planctomycetota bacterium]